MTKAIYICVGENFVYDVPIGDCGEAKTLQKWLEHLFPNKTPESLKEYFQDDTDNEIVTYIFMYKGKRLEKVKK